jgi:hypothetical protein
MARPTKSSAAQIRVAGVLVQGTPITVPDEQVMVPADKIDAGDIVFRSGGDLPDLGVIARDLLIVESRPSGRAATGELVIATLHDRAFIGRWWAKHGTRAVLDEAFKVIAQGPAIRVLGAVTLILRDETH